MKHRVGIVAAAACGLALVTACGTGPLEVGQASVPGLVRIGTYTQVFASALPANSAQAQVVQGFREGQILWTRSEVAFRLVAPVRDYVTGQALTNLTSAMRYDQKQDMVPAGTDRLFMTRVASITGSRAVITTCDDDSGYYERNPHTGRVNPSTTAQPQQDYLAETWRMGLLDGHWAITGLSLPSLPSQSAESCQPALAAGAPRPPAMPVLLGNVAATMRDASSAHVSGIVAQGGQTLNLDLSMTRSGGLFGYLSEGGADIDVLATGGRTYLRVNAALLQSIHAPADACQLFCGRYLGATAAQAGVTGLSMSSLMGTMVRSFTGTQASEVSFGGTVIFGGVPAWVLQDGQQGTAFVAARGQPTLLGLTAPQQGDGTMTFTQWNTVQLPGPPPASQVVNLNQLSGSQAT
jgi:hypothetical protein